MVLLEHGHPERALLFAPERAEQALSKDPFNVCSFAAESGSF